MLPRWARAMAQKPFVVAVHLFVSVKSYQGHLTAIHQLAFEVCKFFLQLAYLQKGKDLAMHLPTLAWSPTFVRLHHIHKFICKYGLHALRNHVNFGLLTKLFFRGLQSNLQRASCRFSFQSSRRITRFHLRNRWFTNNY